MLSPSRERSLPVRNTSCPDPSPRPFSCPHARERKQIYEDRINPCIIEKLKLRPDIISLFFLTPIWDSIILEDVSAVRIRAFQEYEAAVSPAPS